MSLRTWNPPNPWDERPVAEIIDGLERISAEAHIPGQDSCLLLSAADRLRTADALTDVIEAAMEIAEAGRRFMTEDQGDDEALDAAWQNLSGAVDEMTAAASRYHEAAGDDLVAAPVAGIGEPAT